MVSRAFPYILSDTSPDARANSTNFVGDCRGTKSYHAEDYEVHMCEHSGCDHKFLVSRSVEGKYEHFYCTCCAPKAMIL